MNALSFGAGTLPHGYLPCPGPVLELWRRGGGSPCCTWMTREDRVRLPQDCRRHRSRGLRPNDIATLRTGTAATITDRKGPAPATDIHPANARPDYMLADSCGAQEN